MIPPCGTLYSAPRFPLSFSIKLYAGENKTRRERDERWHEKKNSSERRIFPMSLTWKLPLLISNVGHNFRLLFATVRNQFERKRAQTISEVISLK